MLASLRRACEMPASPAQRQNHFVAAAVTWSPSVLENMREEMRCSSKHDFKVLHDKTRSAARC